MQDLTLNFGGAQRQMHTKNAERMGANNNKIGKKTRLMKKFARAVTKMIVT